MSNRRRTITIVLLLWALVAAVYFPAGHFGFAGIDDPDNITHNAHLQPGLSRDGIHWATTGFLMGHWTPLTRLTYLADQTFFRLNPRIMHSENIAVHAAASSMLFLLLLAATGLVWRSAIVAALFAVHPMHVESVVWLTERRDVMSALFLFASLWAYVRYTQTLTSRWGTSTAMWFSVSIAFYALSLLSKATGITLPALLILLDCWPLRRMIDDRGKFVRGSKSISLLAEKIPFACLAAGAALLAMRAQHAAGAAASMIELPLSSRLGNVAVTFPIYIAKLAIPVNLSVFYPHPGDWPLQAVLAGTALLLGISYFVIRQYSRRAYLAVGWFWFLMMLLPMSGLAQSGPQSMADRYAYLPSVGLFVAVVWLVGDWMVRSTHVSPAPGIVGHGQDTRHTRATVLVSLVIAIYAVVGGHQVRFWRDDDTLYHHAIDATGGSNWFAHCGIAGSAIDRGDTHTAIAEYNRSIADRPSNPEAYSGLAGCWKSDPGEAVKYLRKAVGFAPHQAKYRVQLAAVYFRLDDLDEAERQLKLALQDDPENHDGITGLADVESHLRARAGNH